MRESMGNAFVMYMVASIIGVIMLFFVGSISYSKAYKVKNKIVNLIEENGKWDSNIDNEINDYLKEVGYQVGTGRNTSECNCDSTKGCDKSKSKLLKTGEYNYCALYFSSNGGYYYKVVTFMKFEFPIIGNVVEFPVKGETKTFGFFNSK